LSISYVIQTQVKWKGYVYCIDSTR